jgi:hypothetical protein
VKKSSFKSRIAALLIGPAYPNYFIWERFTMKRGNPNFTNPAAIELSRDLPTSFEKVVEELKLDPSEYASSLTLPGLGLTKQRSTVCSFRSA